MTTSEIVINLRVNAIKAKEELKEAQAEMKQMAQSATSSSTEVEQGYRDVAEAQQKAHKAQEALNEQISTQFPAWALSVMFFGMVVQRTMSKIWRTSSATFQDVMHSVEGTVTQFDHLNGAMTWLKFVMGAALEPIAAMLYPIVLAMADWVNENQKLVRNLTVILGIVGGLSAVIGGAVVAIAGFKKAWASLQLGFAAFKAGGSIMTGLKGIAAIFGGSMVLAIGTLVTAVVLLVAAWKTNFGGFKDFITETFGVILVVVKDIFTELWNIVKNLFELIINVMEGDWQGAWDNVKEITKSAVKIVGDVVLGLGALIANALIFAFRTVKDVVFGFVDASLAAMQKIYEFVGATGMASEVRNARNAISSTGDALDLEYITADNMRDMIGKETGGTTTVLNTEVNIEGGIGSGQLANGEWLAEQVSQHMIRELDSRGT